VAARYSGNVEVRMSFRRMRGWNGKRGWFYTAKLYLPGFSADAILSPREAGVKSRDLTSPEAYDQAARAFLELGDEETNGFVREHANRTRKNFTVVRLEESPCPLEDTSRDPDSLEERVLHYIRYEAEDRDDAAQFARANTREVAEHFGVSLEVARRALQHLAKRDLVTKVGRIAKRRGMRPSFQGNIKGEVGLQLWEVHW
jgi:hypothetical protein